MTSPLLSEATFGSFLSYSPRGSSDVSRRSQAVRRRLKRGDPEILARAIELLTRDFADTELSQVLGPDVVLVPTPRSSPLVEGALWPGRLIAQALCEAGFGQSVAERVERVEAVPKSAFSSPGARPNALRHYETMRAETDLVSPPKFTLVDDFVTKGATLLGAASRLREACPGSEVTAFALVRTLGLQPEIERIIDPCVGKISAFGDGADRVP